ncbi:MAG: 2-C-methyl-D-erythritol 4-phosphate cytidylyltransferase [Candidatus Omnitrophica bacterium]|nr:2-C-methyl-D-erythritol 4-phosphate cytidylyltransferase [Candidatus Omnitrophota bacterium]MDD5027175.1 2-C-methyl-D-erythritol 4-phosphate cytidylyltransferase [Candidatus Omnitrophota bacterium]MDD5662202.1 2-C-methyl-D-erythritol 4-phosphate cytidylyltransferase [Candidatus Omnitrophota bacterium]
MVSAIIVAAGKGRRFGHKVSKAVLPLNSRPVIAYSLAVFNAHPQVKEIIVVGNPGNILALRDIVKREKIAKDIKIVPGGKERRDSVAKGLQVVDPKAGFILIHDAARPFITKVLVSSVIKGAQKNGAAIAAVPVKATIKKVQSGLVVEKTLDRKSLWEIQTPQVFKKGLILKAYKKFKRLPATDDAMLVERLGAKVKVVLGSSSNIKITTPEDFIIAKGIAGLWKTA